MKRFHTILWLITIFLFSDAYAQVPPRMPLSNIKTTGTDVFHIGRLNLDAISGIAIDAGGGRVTNIGTATSGGDATNKTYTDAAVAAKTLTLTGDITGTGNSSIATSLSATGVSANSYGDSSHIPIFTVDAKGRLTAASSTSFSAGITQLTGDITAGPGAGSQATTLAASGVTPTTYGDASHVNQSTYDSKGRATSASSVPIAIASSAVSGLGSLATLSSVDLSGAQATGTLAAGRFPALNGPVTTTAGSLTTAIANGAISNVMLANGAVANLSGVNSGDQTISLTGDLSGSGTASFATTLATVNSNVGSFGGAASTGTFTVNGKGLITAASSTSIQIAESQVTTLTTDLAGKQAGPLTGDVTTSGAASTIAAGAVTLAKQSNLAANSIQGNNTGSAATPLALTVSQVQTMIGLSGYALLTGGSGGQTIIGGTANTDSLILRGTSNGTPTSGAVKLGSSVADLVTLAGTITNGSIKYTNTVAWYPVADSTTAMIFRRSNNATGVVDFDTLNSRVGINNTSPAYEMDVSGTVNANTKLLTPIIDRAASGTLTLGSTNVTSIIAAKLLTLNGGLTASGAVSNDFSGSTGTFKTSTGAVTVGGGASAIGITSSAAAVTITAGAASTWSIANATAGSGAALSIHSGNAFSGDGGNTSILSGDGTSGHSPGQVRIDTGVDGGFAGLGVLIGDTNAPFVNIGHNGINTGISGLLVAPNFYAVGGSTLNIQSAIGSPITFLAGTDSTWGIANSPSGGGHGLTIRGGSAASGNGGGIALFTGSASTGGGGSAGTLTLDTGIDGGFGSSTVEIGTSNANAVNLGGGFTDINNHGRVSVLQLSGNGPAPTYSAGAAAGTSPTISVSGSDIAGNITVTTGSTPSASAKIATITFSTYYPSFPARSIALTPANAATAALSGTAAAYVDPANSSFTTFDMTMGSTALSASTTYRWYYQVIK